MRIMFKSKIHGAVVTEANLRYTGSITIDKKLMKEADLLPYEQVHVFNLHNGSRIETYVMEGKRDSGIICMNGAAARHAQVGDKLIIVAYGLYDNEFSKKMKPKIVVVNEKNRIVKR